MKPVIAVSSYIANKDIYYGYGTSGDYIKAIDGAGGIPVQLLRSKTAQTTNRCSAMRMGC